jgi:hypothetical protein
VCFDLEKQRFSQDFVFQNLHWFQPRFQSFASHPPLQKVICFRKSFQRDLEIKNLLKLLISWTKNIFKVLSKSHSKSLIYFQPKFKKDLVWVSKTKAGYNLFQNPCVDLISKSKGCDLPLCKNCETKDLKFEAWPPKPFFKGFSSSLLETLPSL